MPMMQQMPMVGKSFKPASIGQMKAIQTKDTKNLSNMPMI